MDGQFPAVALAILTGEGANDVCLAAARRPKEEDRTGRVITVFFQGSAYCIQVTAPEILLEFLIQLRLEGARHLSPADRFECRLTTSRLNGVAGDCGAP